MMKTYKLTILFAVAFAVSALIASSVHAQGEAKCECECHASTLIPVTVFGEVEEVGVYNIPPGSTLVRALAMAGGFTKSAKSKEVRVVRSVGTDQPTVHLLNVKAVLNGESPDFVLQPDDIINVPASVF